MLEIIFSITTSAMVWGRIGSCQEQNSSEANFGFFKPITQESGSRNLACRNLGLEKISNLWYDLS
jgi:hypothetical protein